MVYYMEDFAESVLKGRPIITEQTETSKLMEPEELLVWEMLYQTIVDCFKVATGGWKWFRVMMWHHQYDDVAILATARQYVKDWIECERFWCYLNIAGFDADKAVIAVRGVLNGERTEEVRGLLKIIGKQRDERRNREDNSNGQK